MIEKEELKQQKRRQNAANAANKKRDEATNAITGLKAARLAGINDSQDNLADARNGLVLNRENLSRLDADNVKNEMPTKRQ